MQNPPSCHSTDSATPSGANEVTWQGLSASVKAAVAAMRAKSPHIEAILFVPCDLPLLSSAHIDAMFDAYQVGQAFLVVSQWNDVLGIPALFDRSLWPEFEDLSGDEGA